MRKLLPLLTLMACAIPAAGYSQTEGAEPMLPSDNRIKVLMYDEADVYVITTKYGYQTNIVFSPNESIDTISVGDRSLWQIIPSGNRMFIRPMEDGVTTNMTVLTNKRSYQFDLKSIAADAAGSNIYVAKFMYPDDMPARSAAPVEPSIAPAYISQVGKTVPVAGPPPLNYNYTYTGPDDLAPLQVYDDGNITYIQYRELKEPAPAIYAMDASGKEQPIPHSVKGNLVVIDLVTGELSLRSGSGTVTVYNELLNPR
jgi:type IV secretion system protein VirB9